LCSFIKLLWKDLNFVCFTQREITGSFQNKWVCFVLDSRNFFVKCNSVFDERLGLCMCVFTFVFRSLHLLTIVKRDSINTILCIFLVFGCGRMLIYML
jgi:hypothetical protein